MLDHNEVSRGFTSGNIACLRMLFQVRDPCQKHSGLTSHVALAINKHSIAPSLH